MFDEHELGAPMEVDAQLEIAEQPLEVVLESAVEHAWQADKSWLEAQQALKAIIDNAKPHYEQIIDVLQDRFSKSNRALQIQLFSSRQKGRILDQLDEHSRKQVLD